MEQGHHKEEEEDEDHEDDDNTRMIPHHRPTASQEDPHSSGDTATPKGKIFLYRVRFQTGLVHKEYPHCCQERCTDKAYGMTIFLYQKKSMVFCTKHQVEAHMLWPELIVNPYDIYVLDVLTLEMCLYKE